jgi:hypothetical protein
MPATVHRRPRPFAPVHGVVDRIAGNTLARIGIVAGTALAAMLAVRTYGRPYSFFDLGIYHGAVGWWVSGGDLYQYVAPNTTLGFTYPPFAMLPMLLFTPVAAGWVNLTAGLVALAFILATFLNPIADRQGWPRWFVLGLAVPLAAATEPVRETLGFGQVNLLLAALVVADLVALRGGARAAAAATAAAPTFLPSSAPAALSLRKWIPA